MASSVDALRVSEKEFSRQALGYFSDAQSGAHCRFDGTGATLGRDAWPCTDVGHSARLATDATTIEGWHLTRRCETIDELGTGTGSVSEWETGGLSAGTEDRGADTDHGRALGDGDLEVVAHAHRKLRKRVAHFVLEPIPQLTELSEPGPRGLRVLRPGRNRHQTANRQPIAADDVFEQLARILGKRPRFLRFFGHVDLDQHVQSSFGPVFCEQVLEAVCDLESIYGVDDVKDFEGGTWPCCVAAVR